MIKKEKFFAGMLEISSYLFETHGDFPLNAIRILMSMPENDPVPQARLCEALGLSTSTMTRNVALLSGYLQLRGGDAQPISYIETWRDPMNRRHSILGITPAGRALRNTLFEFFVSGGTHAENSTNTSEQ